MNRALTAGRTNRRFNYLSLLLVMLTACSTQLCTMAGCQGAIVVEQDAFETWIDSDTYSLEVCIDGVCRSYPDPDMDQQLLVPTATKDGELRIPIGNWDASEEMIVEVTANVGSVSLYAAGTVRFNLFSPNGEECGPTCGSAHIEISGDQIRNFG